MSVPSTSSLYLASVVAFLISSSIFSTNFLYSTWGVDPAGKASTVMFSNPAAVLLINPDVSAFTISVNLSVIFFLDSGSNFSPCHFSLASICNSCFLYLKYKS